MLKARIKEFENDAAVIPVLEKVNLGLKDRINDGLEMVKTKVEERLNKMVGSRPAGFESEVDGGENGNGEANRGEGGTNS